MAKIAEVIIPRETHHIDFVAILIDPVFDDCGVGAFELSNAPDAAVLKLLALTF